MADLFKNLIGIGGHEKSTIDYAKKILPMIEKIPMPSFGKHSTEKGYHPNMLDPYWFGVKNVPKYESVAEWKAQVALTFAGAVSMSAAINAGSLPLPTQKTVNDWFALSSLVDGGINGTLAYHAMEVAFIYNQDDKVFNAFKAEMQNGKLHSNNLSVLAELIENGEYYNPGISDDRGLGIIDFSITKHPFWNGMDAKIDAYESNPGSVAQPYPNGTKIDPKLPIPNVKNEGGLKPTVDYGTGGSNQDTTTPDATPQVEKLVELYIGFFGRAAEHSGLEHHKAKLASLLNSGLTEDQAFTEIANDFWQAGKEFSHMTGFTEHTSNFDFIAKVYENVLGRPDAVQNDREGIEFWNHEMTYGGRSHGEMVLKILEGAHHYMQENPHDHVTAYVGSLLDNRTDISLFFSQETISGDLFGNQAIQTGWDVINRIDQNASSVNNVKNALVNNTLLDLPELDLVGTGSLMMMDEAMMM